MAHVGEELVEQRVHLYGEAGTLEVDVSFDSGAEIRFRGARSDEKRLRTLPVPNSYGETMDRTDAIRDLFIKQDIGGRLFINAILDDRPISPNFYDGLKVQQVVDAAVESDKKGVWVSLL